MLQFIKRNITKISLLISAGIISAIIAINAYLTHASVKKICKSDTKLYIKTFGFDIDNAAYCSLDQAEDLPKLPIYDISNNITQIHLKNELDKLKTDGYINDISHVVYHHIHTLDDAIANAINHIDMMKYSVQESIRNQLKANLTTELVKMAHDKMKRSIWFNMINDAEIHTVLFTYTVAGALKEIQLTDEPCLIECGTLSYTYSLKMK